MKDFINQDEATALLTNFNCCLLKKDSPKRPQGDNWQNRPRKPTEWTPGTGIGVICGNSPEGLAVHGLDVDARNEILADQMRAEILHRLQDRPGKKLARIGNPPKFLIPFTMAHPINKQQTAAYYPDGDEKNPNKNQLEILGTGNQFVAYQIHPDTGRPYGCLDLETGEVDDLHRYTPADLVQLTQADLDHLKAMFCTAAELEGLEVPHREQQARTAPRKLYREPQEKAGIIDKVNDDPRSMAEVLESFGYPRKKDDRHLYPHSTTGDPGVWVFVGDDGRERCYSHHSSDPLNDGHSHDKFSVVTVLQYGGNASAAVRELAAEVDPEGQKERQTEHAKEQQTVTVPDFDELLERTEKKPIENIFALPPNPPELLALPGCLGEIQTFIYNRMTYPDRAAAGITALATLTGFAQTNITIKSRDGLGFNEYYLYLMPTGFGKEDLRKPPEILANLAKDALTGEILAEVGGGNLAGVDAVTFRHAMPASPQGIHQLLEKTRSMFFLADEFAEWLKLTHGEAAKQAALGYLMQAYTRAKGTIEPGHAVSKEYTPVNNPRISILATSTAEAIFETMSKEQADSGAYNRQVIFVGDEELPQKRYDGLIYDPEQHLVDFIAKVTAYPPETKITFAPDGWKAFIELDQELAEPIKRKDGLLGGRLAEQAIKMAGLFALSDGRLTITAQDIRSAFAIRVGLYHRAATLARHRGHLDGLHHTTKAMEQVADVFRRREGLTRSQLPAYSRKFEKLTVQEQKLVIDALIENGIAAPAKDKRAFLVSLVYDERNQ